jgi:catechol 2,3-dioxygenase-like lactoylglutathione lyase family enzyme
MTDPTDATTEMDWLLEVVVLPVADVDRAKAFYEHIGFSVDVDHRAGEQFRVVQMTPPGSRCSISFGVGISDAAPGSTRGLHLVVTDIEAAHAHLVARGVDAGEIHHFEGGQRASGPDPARADYSSFLGFADPDGNTWAVQEVRHHAR